VPMSPPEGFKDLSPLGKIPALSDGDFHIADSSVICAYLERKHPTPPFYPADPREYARALWIEEYADGALSQDVLAAFFQKVIRPGMLNEPTDQSIVDQAIQVALPPKLSYVESLVGSRFLVGDRFGIADIALTSSLINYLYAGFPLDGSKYPRLKAYLERIARHPSVEMALKGESQIVSQMGLDSSFFTA
jgi:glutathione S-transferase